MGPRDALIKADVKDFYMSGHPVTLAKHAASFAPPAIREVVESAVLHILSNQFVCLDGDFFRVVLGSGMGFFFSQDIADAAFIREMEEPHILTQTWHTRYGIKFYARFRDDIFMVANPPMVGWYPRLRSEWSRSDSFVIDE